jgi:hypothetical protein
MMKKWIRQSRSSHSSPRIINLEILPEIREMQANHQLQVVMQQVKVMVRKKALSIQLSCKPFKILYLKEILM